MVAILLASGLCLSPPLFAMDGPPCANEALECGCSECIQWDATPGATRYEIIRQTISTGATYRVGTILSQLNDDGSLTLPTLWCVGEDSSFPREGTTYRYQVKACSPFWIPECGALSNEVLYVGAPYACFVGGREVQCYVGDPLVTR